MILYEISRNRLMTKVFREILCLWFFEQVIEDNFILDHT